MSAKSMTDSFKRLHEEHVGDERPAPPAPNPAPAAPAPAPTAPPPAARPTPVPAATKAKTMPAAPKPEPDAEKTKNLHIRIPESVHKALRRMSAETDRTHRDLVADAIDSFVSKYKD